MSETNQNRVKIDISTSTIIKILATIFIVWFLIAVKEVAVLFILSVILVAALTPLVDLMSKYIPRTLSVVILGLVFLGLLVGFGFLLVPPLVSEIKQLAVNLPTILSKFGPFYHSIQVSLGNYQELLLNISDQIGGITSGLYTTTIGFISGIVAFITIVFMSFYMLVDKESAYTYVKDFIPQDKRENIATISRKLSHKMSQWLGGHLLLMLVVGILYGIALSILGIPYALILAVWGGLMEFIPYLGPWLAAVPAVLIAFTISPLAALITAIVYVIIQLIESNFLAPKIIGRAVGLSPVIIILALLVGAKLMGIIGMLMAVPIAVIISVVISQWSEIRNIIK